MWRDWSLKTEVLDEAKKKKNLCKQHDTKLCVCVQIKQ